VGRMAEWISRLARAGGGRIERGYGQALSRIRLQSFGTPGKYLAAALSCAVPSCAERKSFRHSNSEGLGQFPDKLVVRLSAWRASCRRGIRTH